VGKNTIYPVRELITERAVRCYACPTRFSRSSERPHHSGPINQAGMKTRVLSATGSCQTSVRVSHEHCSTKKNMPMNHQMRRKLFHCTRVPHVAGRLWMMLSGLQGKANGGQWPVSMQQLVENVRQACRLGGVLNCIIFEPISIPI
jgi:hypothetical protein